MMEADTGNISEVWGPGHGKKEKNKISMGRVPGMRDQSDKLGPI